MKKRSRIQTQKETVKQGEKKKDWQKKKKRPRTSSQNITLDTSSDKEELAPTSRTLQEGKEITKEKIRPEKVKRKKKNKSKDIYNVLDEETAAAVKRDDEEIAMLEKNLGLHKGSKDKKKLNKEYAKLEGYGDDFGDFLDGLDGILENIVGGDSEEYEDTEIFDELHRDSDDSESNDEAVSRAKELLRKELEVDMSSGDGESVSSEEMVPMKGGSDDDNDLHTFQDSTVDEDQSDDEELRRKYDILATINDQNEANQSYSDSLDEVRDHDERFTYRPVSGQDLYGNSIEADNGKESPSKKYVPPHLRKKQDQHASKVIRSIQLENDEDDPERRDKLRTIQRLLNSNLNRLADNTLESVGKSISSMYRSNDYSIRDINECLWKNMKSACVVEHMIRLGLIPIYLACISGVHFQAGDAVQLGGDVIERSVLALWHELETYRNGEQNTDSYPSKKAANFMLILCYLYNYSVVHCTLIYDLVRQFIENFTELDVELLLLILSHCGQQLRTDDPSALKDIVIMVQKRSMEMIQNKNGTRSQHLITTIIDLRNNKRKKHDEVLWQKSCQYRKIIGRMKSTFASIGDGRSVGSNSLRLTIQDILDIETKGRWWKVGAKWAGHQPREDKTNDIGKQSNIGSQSDFKLDAKQEKLMALATKQRMNTELRRSIFCVVMGSDDCRDAFENLVRNNMLKGKNERETVRVIVHCCGTEKVYNPYYAHLANRVCEYQSSCKFTFQLTFWDWFKQFDTMKARKAANLAKLLAYLIINYRVNMNVLKIIDISPDDMTEAAIIFLTILFTNIFEAFDDPTQVAELFKRGEPKGDRLSNGNNVGSDDGNVTAGTDEKH
eukprot:CAMPEP_0203676362 /NCGR_PEP_ID=MMETSP0090-20130426/24288_1 /ASSEMBLY_ACC=CAM_ASM_001088 /TAXON_ID=426623 /ORGANISM="Chaetoceros affinis, Strain CCMP159" /LENGTH=839 /DNA_ID=CAMNT_0050542887 /DNA_START=111 /DNA_END=2632 /DNA_ORIENTATION=-